MNSNLFSARSLEPEGVSNQATLPCGVDMLLETKDLQEGDIVILAASPEAGHTVGGRFVIDSRAGNTRDHLSLCPVTKANRRDRRYYAGWSGFYGGCRWKLVERRDQPDKQHS